MEGFRALFSPRVRPFLKAAAAMLVGVFGVVGVSDSALFASCGEANGSVCRKACEAAECSDCLVLTTSEARLAIREDFRGGSWVTGCSGAMLLDVVDVCDSEAMEEIDIRRMVFG